MLLYVPLFVLRTLFAVPVLSSPLALPRMTVPHLDDNARLFREEGVSNYSCMLLREDLGLLLVGARDVIYALDMQNVSRKKSEVKWAITKREQEMCMTKGKAEVDCQNYIRILHTVHDGRIYACGTNAFSPLCTYMTYNEGQLQLQGSKEDGKGKCPFDPHQRYASLMADDDLYSATTLNFLGSNSALTRNSRAQLSTEIQDSWLSDPRFIYMTEVPESLGSSTGDDDKVYLFFNEVAVEYDFYKKLMVSRVARVCKGDLGGQRTLQRRWTSFLKARLDCPVLESSMPFIMQDAFLWRDSNWKTSIFYAVFTLGSMNMSAVCAYKVEDVSLVFSKGRFKKSINVENADTKWVPYGGELPQPRPGACIDDAARNMGVKQSLDIPDGTLQFLRGQPLMDTVVQPLKVEPQLIKRGPAFTRIVVDSVLALDRYFYFVMFIGTENGSVLKAVNYGSDVVIVEELHLFGDGVPVEVLRLSVATGALYAGSSSGVVQVPLRGCSRYKACLDCVLARDPYCAWDTAEGACVAVPPGEPSPDRELIQRVKDGNGSLCPRVESTEPKNVTLDAGINVKLPCQQGSNLAQTVWLLNGKALDAPDIAHVHADGLLVFGNPLLGAGLYECQSVERGFVTKVATYLVQPGNTDPSIPMPGLQREACNTVALKVTVVLLSLLLAMLLVWDFCKGHISLPWCLGSRRHPQPPPPLHNQGYHQGPAEIKLLANRSANNNHCGLPFPADGPGTPRSNGSSMFNPQFIADESEI
ncbi:semaphorin-4E-like [Brienomyrus brachyistius]|uniref:semaphorin-4E-like n=1 Tax=Brienomyrus brachyistius TaxID=42636 RepID=UPI0020B2C6A3|nr:semaphorin-4E-like [Brienomyrus brachyistius]XP_048844868.1 semaphorin-4E-like [Brienomyrus brachyistius]XP_048844869.1 semaphorin-4E-like [Brienomyrus brachyistius]XP_048844870.1 semaphorin-4E-like [Brienomyrus brachyistius]XP_048844871.1 semaphorin-4E-like [Brienomyrus brachyistius]